MKRILRDIWAWRGGLAPDEILYKPRLADARDGPIREPAWRHWPMLVSQVEVGAAVSAASGLSVRQSLGPVATHLLLVDRSGGYHAVLPRRTPEVERKYAAIRGGEDDVPGYKESLELLEQAGVVEFTHGRLGLVRPVPPTLPELYLAKELLDRHDVTVPSDSMTQRVLSLAWERVFTGIGLRRYQELIRFRRLLAHVRAEQDASAAGDEACRVGPMALPQLPSACGVEPENVRASRGWFGLLDINVQHGERDGALLLATGYEIGALLLGAGVGSNAVRRAVRASIVWLLLAEQTRGEVGWVEVPLAVLARRAAEMFVLPPGGDHRSRIRSLLDDLECAGAIGRPHRDAGVRMVRSPAPDDEQIRHFLTELAAWQARNPDEPGQAALELASRHVQTHVRGGWIRLLQERRMSVEVLSFRR